MSERGKFEMWAKDFYPLDMDADPETGATDYLEGDTLAAWCGWQAAKAESAAEIAALRAELEDARKDAGRYRWLRDNVEQVYARPRTEIACDWGMKWQIKPYLVAVSAVATDVTFDAAIDAAMTNEG